VKNAVTIVDRNYHRNSLNCHPTVINEFEFQLRYIIQNSSRDITDIYRLDGELNSGWIARQFKAVAPSEVFL
jgi:hypothetical protein